MKSRVEDLVSQYEDGTLISEFLPLKERIEILTSKTHGELVGIHWKVNGVAYSARAGNLDERDIPYFVPSEPQERSLCHRLLRRRKPQNLKRFVRHHCFPDRTGFVRIEAGWDRADNCLLLDEHGRPGPRLTVPCSLVGSNIPQGAAMSFGNISEPYVNPETGERGRFGLSASIEHAGAFYFELDWKAARFVWGRPIRD